MTLAWWRLLMARLTREPIRARHERLTEEARKRLAADGRLFDAYPDNPRTSTFSLYVQTRGPGGRFIREEVELAWPLELTDFTSRGGQLRIVRGVALAFRKLRDRVG